MKLHSILYGSYTHFSFTLSLPNIPYFTHHFQHSFVLFWYWHSNEYQQLNFLMLGLYISRDHSIFFKILVLFNMLKYSYLLTGYDNSQTENFPYLFQLFSLMVQLFMCQLISLYIIQSLYIYKIYLYIYKYLLKIFGEILGEIQCCSDPVVLGTTKPCGT